MNKTIAGMAVVATLTITSSTFAAEIPISVSTVGNIAPGQDWSVDSAGGFFNEPCAETVDLSDQPRELVVTLSSGHQDVFEYRPTFFGFGSAISGGCLGTFEIMSTPGNRGSLELGPLPGFFSFYSGSPDIFWPTLATDITFDVGSLLFGEVFEPGYRYTIDGQSFDLVRTVTEPIPAPGALALFLTGMTGLLARTRRRKRSAPTHQLTDG